LIEWGEDPSRRDGQLGVGQSGTQLLRLARCLFRADSPEFHQQPTGAFGEQIQVGDVQSIQAHRIYHDVVESL
jgi:hypothetical protein